MRSSQFIQESFYESQSWLWVLPDPEPGGGGLAGFRVDPAVPSLVFPCRVRARLPRASQTSEIIMAKSAKPRCDASDAITNELIRIIERGVLPWRKPWTAGASTRPLRHGGEAYQGINNFLLTMRTVMAGYGSPYWMTVPQANTLGGKVRKGEKSAIVVYYGQSH